MSEKAKTLALLDSMNEEGRISYDAYAELHDAVTAIEEPAEGFEYAYGYRRLDGKPGLRVLRTYQALKHFIASGYNFPGEAWRRPVGAWESIDPKTGEPNG